MGVNKEGIFFRLTMKTDAANISYNHIEYSCQGKKTIWGGGMQLT